MVISRSGDIFVGLVALALLVPIGRRILRGLRDGRLPLYRSSIGRQAGAVRFGTLLALHVLSLLLVAVVAADLLLNLGLRERL